MRPAALIAAVAALAAPTVSASSDPYATHAKQLAHNVALARAWCRQLKRTPAGCTGTHHLFTTYTPACTTSRFSVYTTPTWLFVSTTCRTAP
jgi:Tfp pilus assembly protein FimT